MAQFVRLAESSLFFLFSSFHCNLFVFGFRIIRLAEHNLASTPPCTEAIAVSWPFFFVCAKVKQWPNGGKKHMKPKNTLKFLFMVLKLFVFSSWVVFILFALRGFFSLSIFIESKDTFFLTSLHIQMQMLLLATPWIKIMEKRIQQQFTQWAYFTYLIWKCFWYICKDPVRVRWNGIDYHSSDRRQNNLQNGKQSKKSQCHYEKWTSSISMKTNNNPNKFMLLSITGLNCRFFLLSLIPPRNKWIWDKLKWKANTNWRRHKANNHFMFIRYRKIKLKLIRKWHNNSNGPAHIGV